MCLVANMMRKKIYVSYVNVYQTQNSLLEYQCKICTLMLFFFVDDSITVVQCNSLILKIIMKWFIKSLHTYKFFTDHMKLLFGRLVGVFFSISLTFIYSIYLIPFVLSYVQSGLLNIMFGKERLAGDLISVINLNDVLVMHDLYLWLSHPRSQRR